MNFLHLSTGDVRGAFTGAYRLHENLRSAGHTSRMFVFRKESSDPDVLTLSPEQRRMPNLRNRFLHQVVKRVLSRREEFDKRYFFPYRGIGDFSAMFQAIPFRPDAIIVYYVADFLSAKDLLRIQEHFAVPLIFYLMDAGMLTGGCHYPWGCSGFRTECGTCPVFRRGVSGAWPHRLWRERQEIFGRLDYSVVAGSQWLMRMTAASSLHRQRRCDKILMGLDPTLFMPRRKSDAREALGLKGGVDHLVLYFGAQMIDDKRKGFDLLFAALKLLPSMIGADLREKIILFTVGDHPPAALEGIPFKSHHVPYLKEKNLFATTYNAADLFICPSVEDAGPMMINEAMMSGTPVVAFPMGVAEDLIENGRTGFLAQEFSSRALAQKIAAFLLLGEKERVAMAAQCRTKALRLSSVQVQVDKFVALTEELGRNRAGGR